MLQEQIKAHAQEFKGPNCYFLDLYIKSTRTAPRLCRYSAQALYFWCISVKHFISTHGIISLVREATIQAAIAVGKGCRPEMEAGRVFMVYSKSPKSMCPMKAIRSATRSTVYPTSQIQGIACRQSEIRSQGHQLCTPVCSCSLAMNRTKI